jgi:hypothetical protein
MGRMGNQREEPLWEKAGLEKNPSFVFWKPAMSVKTGRKENFSEGETES